MPPRSANRKKSTAASVRGKKTTPKSKQSAVESSLADDNTVTVLDNKDQDSAPLVESGTQQEDVSAAAKVQEAEEAVLPVVIEKEIKQEIGILYADTMEVEGLTSTVVEVKVKEEVVEEEQNVETVMEDRMNVNTGNVIKGNGVAEEGGETMEGGLDKNDNGITADVVQKGENAAEEKEEVEGEQNCGGEVGTGGSQLVIVQVAEHNSVEEETAAAAQINSAKALGDSNNVLAINEGSDGEGEGEESGNDEEDNEDSEENDEVDNEDDEDPSVFIHDPLTERKKQKDLEIFIGRLDKGAVEDDLIKVFGKFGEIKAARIVRNPTTNKSKGFAFIRYATVEQAKNTLSELKDGIEVRGKHVKISASQDNDTLYMGNICKTWTKERVLGTLKRYGIEHVEEIHLPDDPKNERKIKGFALLEFSTHSDAMAAFQRLRKPDAVFGRDRSAKVAFAQTPMHPHEEVMSQVKTVYVEGLTDAWNEEKVKESFKQYGEIVKVKLYQNLGTKRKDFGFITFTSRESALACMEGINNACFREGEGKVTASIAKPQYKGRLQKQGFRGGFKIKKKSKVAPSKKESESTKQAGSSKMKGHAKSKGAERKGNAVAEEKENTPSESKIVEGGKPNEAQTVTDGQFVGAPSKLDKTNRKRKNLPLNADGRGKGGVEHGYSKRPSKKSRGNKHGRQSNNLRNNPKRDPHIRKGPNYGADFITYKNPYAPGYPTSAANYQGHAYSATSGSKRRYTDMEPHAGYLEPVAGKQGRAYIGYLEPAVRSQGQPHAAYLEPAIGTQGHHHAGHLQPAVGTHGQPYAGHLQPAVGTQGRPYARYVGPSVGTQGQPHGGYLEPSVGTQGRPYVGYVESTVRTQGQSHGGYLEPAVVTQSHSHVGYLEPGGLHGQDPYDSGLRRSAGHDGQGSGGFAYGGGSALPPSYTPNYTSYAGYEGGGSVGGYYQSSGAYLPRRRYH